jgi:hypothetical protein
MKPRSKPTPTLAQLRKLAKKKGMRLSGYVYGNIGDRKEHMAIDRIGVSGSTLLWSCVLVDDPLVQGVIRTVALAVLNAMPDIKPAPKAGKGEK